MAKYIGAYNIIQRLKRFHLVKVDKIPGERGHVISLTEEGIAAARQLAADAGPLVAIYARVPFARSNYDAEAVDMAPRIEANPASIPSIKRPNPVKQPQISCPQCHERLSLSKLQQNLQKTGTATCSNCEADVTEIAEEAVTDMEE